MAQAEGGISGNAMLASICLTMLVGIFGALAFMAFKMVAASEEEQKAEEREARRRDRTQRGEGDADGGEDDEEDEDDEGEGRAARRGAGKKDQKKQERNQQKQAEREVQQKKESVKSERQQKYNERQKAKDAECEKRDEVERKAREEKEKKQREAHAKWEAMYGLNEEGEVDAADWDEATVERFINQVKMRKVVKLEDLAAEFRIRTSAAVDRLEHFEKLGRLSGIFDDRGKYICITAEEMQQVSEWLQRTGRINLPDLLAACESIIRLHPTDEDKAKLQKEAQFVTKASEEGAQEGEEKAE